jgi:hypothetical protein
MPIPLNLEQKKEKIEQKEEVVETEDKEKTLQKLK